MIATNNRAAIDATQASRDAAEPLGIVGFDDCELAGALGLSVVAHDPEWMGELAAELPSGGCASPSASSRKWLRVLRRNAASRERSRAQVVLPTRVILRGSEGPALTVVGQLVS